MSFSHNKFLQIFLVIVLIIFFHYLSVIRPLEKIIVFALSPFQTCTFTLADKLTQEILKIKIKQDLKIENENLQKRIENLEKQVVDLKIFIEENEFLSQQNKILEKQGWNFVNAKIISRSDIASQHLLIINQGEEKGVKSGMIAVAEGTRVVGKIIKAESQRAFLLLLIDNQCKLSATVAGQSDVAGAVNGEYGLGINLNYILKKADLQVGEMIVTSGLDEHIPGGFLIGEINKIIDNPADLFKQANLSSAVNFNYLKNISVILY